MFRRIGGAESLRPVRYFVNGLVATAVHFGLLTLNMQVLAMRSAALANVCAAVGGIMVSFLGNRYFVFQAHANPILGQAAKFGVLYAGIAGLHGLVLFFWTDLWGLDFRLGFLGATALQMTLSYLGNKALVFAQ